ncbi:kinase-like domain-containing protein [Butyriboletus roseoflavus]|nr:kinase-like domain-containing protein [Butyriboletus roseoflavus]
MDGRDFSGQQVGRYLLSSLLGSGAAGSVYQAVDTASEDSPAFAIKCIPESHITERRRRQIAEIENHNAAAGFPHVMTLCDVIAEDRFFFLVLPLCEMDMFRAIWKKKVYWRNDGLIKKAFLEILDGVFACHKMGIYHRDLKPENIMCDADGTRIQIGDFGLSTNRRVCRDGGCGTAPYMSPECIDKEAIFYYANEADVWSLGVILFNMVTFRYPWEEACPADKAYMTFRSEKDYLLRTSSISEPLNDLLYRIWHPTPMRRMSIPAIRQAIVEMDTFYKSRRGSYATSQLSKELVLVDSQQTYVAPVRDEKKVGTCTPIDVLQNAPLCCLD